jgi:hypothetical protein
MTHLGNCAVVNRVGVVTSLFGEFTHGAWRKSIGQQDPSSFVAMAARNQKRGRKDAPMPTIAFTAKFV